MCRTTPPADIDPFEASLEQSWPNQKWQGLTTLIAVSGGADSISLLAALDAIRKRHQQTKLLARLEVAHFNHGWRDEKSDDDEAFVRTECEQLDVLCHVGRSNQAERTEEVARQERYDFLRKIAATRGARYLLTAHNADDQAETILHRIVRGTSLRGLCGIQPTRRISQALTLVRPMLWARRTQVLDYLDRIGRDFRVDESNSDESYTRNRIRHQLLPHLAQHYNPAVVTSLLRLQGLAQEANSVIQCQVSEHFDECVVFQNDKTVELDRVRLGSIPPFLQREVLVVVWRRQGWPEQSMGFDQWERSVQAIQDGTAIHLPGGIELSSELGVARLVSPKSLGPGQIGVFPNV